MLRRGIFILAAVLLSMGLSQGAVFRGAEAVKISSSHIALVSNACGTVSGAGCMPTSGFSSSYAPTFDNVAIADLPNVINDYDTVALLQNCDIGTWLADSTWHDAVLNWVAAGHKLIIYDADACGGLRVDYSKFAFPFTTENPCQCGAFGASLTIVENNTLSSDDLTSPYYVDTSDISANTDGPGDGSVMLTQDSHWKGDMKATNTNGTSGFVHAYADDGSGLVIYNGLDSDEIAFDSALARVWELELKQQWDPSGLPGSVTVAPSCDFDDVNKNNDWALNLGNVIAAWVSLGCDAHALGHVEVGVADSGVDADHEDLQGAIEDCQPSCGDNGPSKGHGTSVAGIIAARANNSHGAAGVAPAAQLDVVPLQQPFPVSLSVLSPEDLKAEALANGIRQAADMGAKIINVSSSYSTDYKPNHIRGGFPCSYPCDGGFLRTAIEYANAKGALVVAAAGEDSDITVGYPATYATLSAVQVIAVTAVDDDRTLASYARTASFVVAAPGGDFDSHAAIQAPTVKNTKMAVSWSCDGNDKNRCYGQFLGTSAAAPFVSGIAALIEAANPFCGPSGLKAAIENSARLPIGSSASSLGHGIVDALAALHYAGDHCAVDFPPA